MKPTVKSRAKQREGKGYSIAEIVEAKVDSKDMPRLGIRIDPRRKTAYPQNVKNLGEIKKNLKKPEPKKPKVTKKVEQKSEKVEKAE